MAPSALYARLCHAFLVILYIETISMVFAVVKLH